MNSTHPPPTPQAALSTWCLVKSGCTPPESLLKYVRVLQAGAKAIQAYRSRPSLGLLGRAKQSVLRLWRGLGLRGWDSLLRRTPPKGRPAREPGILSAVPCPREGRGRDVTEAATSQAPAPPPPTPNQRVHWRRRGSNQQPPPRLPDRASVSMGVTGANGFPCCGKESVDIVETQGTITQHQFQLAQEKEETEPEKDLLELKPVQKEDLYLKPKVELEPKPKPKDPEQQEYRTEFLQPFPQQDISQWSVRSNSSYLSAAEKGRASANHRSIRVQTSKHLFWADKLIQASEHSLQQAVGRQLDKKSTGKATSHQDQQSNLKDATCSKQQLQSPHAQPALPAADAQQPPDPHPASPSPSPAIGLAELTNFASSLAVASSSNMDLPKLEHMIKAPPQKAEAPSTDPAVPPAVDQPEKEELAKEWLEKPLEAGEPQKAWKQEDKSFPHSYLDFNKPGVKRATIEGEVKLLQAPTISPPPQGAVEEPPQKPRRLPPPDPGEEQPCRTQKGRPQQPTALLTQVEPASIRATGAEQASPRAREGKRLAATRLVQSGSGSGSQSRSSCADENLLPMTPRQLAAFQEIFKLFSPSPTGTVDMRSMRAALRHVGIQLSPQEMCEALRQADLDGDGTVSFKDFLGVLTDSYRLAQCLGQARNSRFYDPQGLQTLFLEILFKLMSQGFVPHKSVQEVMSYYTKKQRALRPNPGWKDRWRDHSGSAGAPGGLTFFCQAARLSGLSSNELELSLHRLNKAGARSPYSQIPNLARQTPPENRQKRAPRPNVRLLKSCQPSSHKLGPNQGSLSAGESR
ncbi:spermatogenesis-associated protein 32 isoform X3 [Panthera uncia]|uniref:spermatogenesis-associated protein 32 isoform X3 n=1 Tax=Panthera uncia TaxID=29064 RepID=UPI0020FFCA1A|nr:spermatogenesis-associated protein 32 isoform X3 [Panthera uncia]